MIARAAGALLLGVTCLAPVVASASPGERTVAPGAAFPVVADGFEPASSVRVQQIGDPAGLTVRANPGGVVHASWTAPRLAGEYRLAVSGPPYVRSAPAPVPGSVSVVVPRVVVVPFRVRAPGGEGGEGIEGISAGPGPQGDAAHRVARTGVGVAVLLGGADLLFVAGIALLAVGRRRRRPAGA